MELDLLNCIILSKYNFINLKSLRKEIMTTYDSYSARYSKSKDKKLHSLSPNPTHISDQPSHFQPSQNSIGKVVSKLSDRIDGVQIKITSLTNIVKLLQKYTETKDEQYEKQKQNVEFKLTANTGNYQAIQLQNKLKQIDLLSQRMKSQVTAMESLRIGISRQNSQKFLYASPEMQITTNNKMSQFSEREIMNEVEALMGDMEDNLREQMNKKIQICMSCLKKAIENMQPVNIQKQFASPKTVNSMNTVMLQQQLHNLTLVVNKIESDCSRNKMITDKKIQEIISYVGQIKKKIINRVSVDNRNHRDRSRSVSVSKNSPLNRQQNQKSENSSISKRSKSHKKPKQPSKSEYQPSKLLQQKKIKQNQLKQALRKKKQHQEKLKMKK